MKSQAIKKLIQRADRDFDAYEIWVFIGVEAFGPIAFKELDERAGCLFGCFNPPRHNAREIAFDIEAIDGLSVVPI